ncbi:MAG TPA: hypothetical protein VMW08_02195 [Acidimicrobiales bacterium]|nr:hypothetical protein [Acidimicrobiales bacterium]
MTEGPDEPLDDVTDELPDDLQPSEYVGPYVFPNNNQRRIPGYLYLLIGSSCVVLGFTRGEDAVLVNQGITAAGVALVLFGLYHLRAGWNLDVDEQDALVIASREVGFAIGHASAQLGWRGIFSRPTWRILAYSADEPPDQRAFVMIDGVDGEVIGTIVEENPEDWSAYE